MSDSFDCIVIGAGPAGYVFSVRAAQLGMKVACIDKRGVGGGTCLNVGCIPSKALLHASEIYEQTGHMADMGIELGKPKLNLSKMMAYKNEVIQGNVKGIDYLFKKNTVDFIHGTARIESANQVIVSLLKGGERSLTTQTIVIATGSKSACLPHVALDEERIVSSTAALAFDSVPKDLTIVGAGIIGLEIGSVWSRLGSKVTVVEFMNRITPSVDAEIAMQLQHVLEKQGFHFMLEHKITDIKVQKARVKMRVDSADGKGQSQQLISDRVLIAIGRSAYTQDLGLEALGIRLDARGHIETDRGFQTNISGIYAIGDVISGPMLAHKAEDEAVALAENLVGQRGYVNYEVIPSVIYTAPEVAWVGKTEEDLRQQGLAYHIGKFPFMANGRAKVYAMTDGFVKILSDTQTDRVLGVHIIGQDAGHLIAEAVMAMEFGASAEDIARTCHAHPTLSEAVKEAALAVDKRAIHI